MASKINGHGVRNEMVMVSMSDGRGVRKERTLCRKVLIMV
jgi:hypothetical protein